MDFFYNPKLQCSPRTHNQKLANEYAKCVCRHTNFTGPQLIWRIAFDPADVLRSMQIWFVVGVPSFQPPNDAVRLTCK